MGLIFQVDISKTKSLEPKTHCVYFCNATVIHIINPRSRVCNTGVTVEFVLLNTRYKKPKWKKHMDYGFQKEMDE